VVIVGEHARATIASGSIFSRGPLCVDIPALL